MSPAIGHHGGVRSRRRGLLLLGLVLTLGIAWWGWLDSDRRRVEQCLDGAGQLFAERSGESGPARAERVRNGLGEYFDESAVVRIGDRPPLVGRNAIVNAAAAAAAERPAVVSIEQVRVELSAERAEASGELAWSESQLGDLHRDQRSFSATLARSDGRFRLQSLTLSAKSHAAPEARP